MLSTLVLISVIALLASAIAIFTAHPLRYLLLGITTFILIAAIGIYGSYAPFFVLAAALALLWMSAFMLPVVILHTRWVTISIRAVLAIALLLTAFLTYVLPTETDVTPTDAYHTGATIHLNSDNLQDTLYSLVQSDVRSNPAYNTLLQDYITFHAVLFIEAGIFTLILIALSAHFWRQAMRMQGTKIRHWSFEKKTYICFGLVSTAVTLFMLLLVAANLSTVVNPQEGFALAIPELGTPQPGTQKAELYQAINTWAQSGSADMPFLLQNGIDNRLSWQRPKAIVCSILLVLLALFTARLWQKLIHNARVSEFVWGLKEKALLATGVIAVPVTLLLMLMALANTEATFAPITLTLLFS